MLLAKRATPIGFVSSSSTLLAMFSLSMTNWGRLEPVSTLAARPSKYGIAFHSAGVRSRPAPEEHSTTLFSMTY